MLALGKHQFALKQLKGNTRIHGKLENGAFGSRSCLDVLTKRRLVIPCSLESFMSYQAADKNNLHLAYTLVFICRSELQE